jgi:hypothetical protein
MVREIDSLLRRSPLLEPHRAALPPDGLLRFYDVTALHDIRTIPLFLITTDVRNADIIVVSSIDPVLRSEISCHAGVCDRTSFGA